MLFIYENYTTNRLYFKIVKKLKIFTTNSSGKSEIKPFTQLKSIHNHYPSKLNLMRKRRKKHANEIIIKVKSPGQM
jgi:hypothetical protein